VIVLDENIVDGQRLLLEGWGIGVRQIGLDVGHNGLKDEQIVVLLRKLRQPTFFTRDSDFYSAELRHHRYSLVVAAVGQYETAGLIRRFLRQREFDSYAKRAGKVIPSRAKRHRLVATPTPEGGRLPLGCFPMMFWPCL
jgi:hypothetical protein